MIMCLEMLVFVEVFNINALDCFLAFGFQKGQLFFDDHKI